MYSEDGNRMCVGRDCERRRKGKFAQVRWKKNPAYVCEYCERTFAWYYNARLRVLRTYIRGCYNERSLVLERTFASAVTVV